VWRADGRMGDSI